MRLGRWIIVGGIVTSVAAAFLYTGSWFNPDALTPARMINAFQNINGPHPGFRRNHAKGLGFSGAFESNGRGAEISKALVFAPGRIPVIGRFALAGGLPNAADATQPVRSMAVLFKLPNGEEWRTGMNNIPVFPVATPQAFYDFMLATAPDPTTQKPDPVKIGAFLAKYPGSAKALKQLQQAPPSLGFENDTFNSLDAFLVTNSAGDTRAVRWAMIPVAHTPSKVVSGSNGMFDALIESVNRHPLQWRLIVTLAASTDPTNDASVSWPPDRTHIDVGVLTIDHVESEDTSLSRDITFDPLILPNGISASDDPLLSGRSATYAQSFKRREGEHKDLSAISPAEAERHP